MNVMRTIKIEKVTLNFGAGKDQGKLDKGYRLLKAISGMNPIKTITNKRIPSWGLRPGLPVGAKVTVRKDPKILIKRLLHALDNKLGEGNFDDKGNVSFGIKEYIDIEGAKYEPEIGIIGLQACVTLTRPGYRIKIRKLKTARIHHKHQITKQEAVDFMVKEFNIKLEDE